MSRKRNKNKATPDFLKETSLLIVKTGIRNTFLEVLHSGIYPSTKTGDYSDVKVVTPYGEIPWNNLSRFNDKEMKALMIECVDNVYTILKALQDGINPTPLSRIMFMPIDWNEPKIDPILYEQLTGKNL